MYEYSENRLYGLVGRIDRQTSHFRVGLHLGLDRCIYVDSSTCIEERNLIYSSSYDFSVTISNIIVPIVALSEYVLE